MHTISIGIELLKNRRRIFACEGGGVYSATTIDGVPCLFTDESALVDSLPEDEAAGLACQTVYAFENEAEREAYARQRHWLRNDDPKKHTAS